MNIIIRDIVVIFFATLAIVAFLRAAFDIFSDKIWVIIFSIISLLIISFWLVNPDIREKQSNRIAGDLSNLFSPFIANAGFDYSKSSPITSARENINQFPICKLDEISFPRRWNTKKHTNGDIFISIDGVEKIGMTIYCEKMISFIGEHIYDTPIGWGIFSDLKNKYDSFCAYAALGTLQSGTSNIEKNSYCKRVADTAEAFIGQMSLVK